MPSIWSYCDNENRGFGLFKRRIFAELERLGWETRLAVTPLLEADARQRLRHHWETHPCEWVLLINQSGGQWVDYMGGQPDPAMQQANKWVWYLDDPRFFMDRPFDSTEYVFSFDETYLKWIEAQTPAYAGFWPLGCDMERTGTVRDEFRCEVSFVGGLIDQRDKRAQLSPEMQEYVDRLVSRKLCEREKTFEQLAEAEPFAPGKQIRINPQVAHFLYWETNNRYRLQVMEALADFDLKIYGNEHWETLLEGHPLKKHFHGAIDPVAELPDVFTSSAVNINIHSIQCRGSLNQRDFNAPVGGGFLLSDWVPAAGRYFQPGVEAVYWSDVNDLRDKVKFYLGNPGERKALIKRGRERVRTRHTYQQRIQQVLRQLGPWL